MVSAQYTNQNRPAVITSPVDPGDLYNGTFGQTLFLARLDQQLSQNNRLTLRANFDRFSDSNPQDAVSGVALPTAARVFTRNTYQAAITDTAIINSNTLNDARFEFLLGDPITQFVPVTLGPQLFVSGYYTYGESRVADLMNHQYEYADTLSLSRGKHQIKFGFDVINSSSGGFGQEFGGGYVDGRFQINPLYKTIPIATLLTSNPGAAAAGSAARCSSRSLPALRSRLATRATTSDGHALRSVCAGQLEHSAEPDPQPRLALGRRNLHRTERLCSRRESVSPGGCRTATP